MKQPVVRQSVSVSAWQGPLPPPEALQSIEAIVPGAADRLLALAENEQRKRLSQIETDRVNAHEETMRTITANHQKNIVGQICATISVMCLVAGCVVCCELKCEKAACALAGCGIVGVVTSFIGRGKSSRN